MRKRMFITVGISVLIVSAVALYLSQESFYSKQSTGERIWMTILYTADNQLASVNKVITKEPSFALPVSLYKQEYPLTCEVASLRMVLGFYGIRVSEDELLDRLAFDTTGPMDDEGVWGDPDKGFVGDVNGSIYHGTGYGVYDAPIRDLARSYKAVVELEDANLSRVIGLVRGGRPVITWGLLRDRTPLYWRTKSGKMVEAFPGEHVRVVIGFTGEQHDPKRLILLDPIYGKIHMDVDKFVSDWQTMKNRAVVVY